MAYVALLRGINVGGKATVEMARLKTTFERLGLERVSTYINSGNVVFVGRGARATLRRRIEQAITEDFGLDVMVLLRSTDELQVLVDAVPASWRNDSDYKCDVFFSDEFRGPDSVERLPFTPGLEEVVFVPGAVVSRIDRGRQSKSRLTKIVGSDLYRQLTVRNVNTARKLHALLEAADS